jgi:hypothetical protein
MKHARRALGAAALVASALLLSACMKMSVDLTLNSDDTVTGEVLLAVSDQAAEAAGMTSDEMLKDMDSEDLGKDAAEVEDYAQDGYTGKRYIFERSTLSEISDDTMKITREGDEFVVDGSLPLTAKDLDMTEEMLADPAIEPLLEKFDVNITVAFPGEVTESNGKIDGNTVTWQAKVGEENKISARGVAISPEEAAAAAVEETAAAAAAAEASAEPAGAELAADSKEDGGFWGSLLGDTLIGGGVGGLVALVFVLIRMARKRNAAARDTAALSASDSAPEATPVPVASTNTPDA